MQAVGYSASGRGLPTRRICGCSLRYFSAASNVHRALEAWACRFPRAAGDFLELHAHLRAGAPARQDDAVQYGRPEPLLCIARLPAANERGERVAAIVGRTSVNSLERDNLRDVQIGGHSGFKSANIVIDPGGKAVGLDFGLAKRLAKNGEPQTVHSIAGNQQAPAGTLSHMAPEVLLGGRADARSDIWSIGVLLYELVTGSLPFKGRTEFETSAAILMSLVHEWSTRCRWRCGSSSSAALSKDPASRYQRASDVREALKRVETNPESAGRLASTDEPQAASAQITAVVTFLILATLSDARVRQHHAVTAPRVETFAAPPLGSEADKEAEDVFARGHD